MEKSASTGGLDPILQSELECIAMKKHASEQDQARLNTLEQYRRVVRMDREEQEQLARDQKVENGPTGTRY